MSGQNFCFPQIVGPVKQVAVVVSPPVHSFRAYQQLFDRAFPVGTLVLVSWLDRKSGRAWVTSSGKRDSECVFNASALEILGDL